MCKLGIRLFQKYHNPLYRRPPKIWNKHCFQFLLGEIAPKEIESNAYAKFWRNNKKCYDIFEKKAYW